jgi:hypothetical protein
VQTFGRDLRAAIPGIRVQNPRVGERRVRAYSGIGLTPTSAESAQKWRSVRDGTRDDVLHVR